MASVDSPEVLIPAREGRALEVAAGRLVEVVDLEGKQVADFVAFTQGDLTEWLSTTHTRSMLGRMRIAVGDTLSSNRRRPMFEVVADDVGVHDLLVAMCDRERYRLDFGLTDHANCRDNMVAALRPWEVAAWQVPDPLNVFQNSPIAADLSVQTAEPVSGPGSRLVLRAVRDVVVAVSACPQDRNPCNGWRPTPILLRVTDPAGVAG